MNPLAVVAEIVGIFWDALRGNRCPICGVRQHHLAAHVYVDHADGS